MKLYKEQVVIARSLLFAIIAGRIAWYITSQPNPVTVDNQTPLPLKITKEQ